MNWRQELDSQGFVMITQAISSDQLKSLRHTFDETNTSSGIRHLVKKFPHCIDFTNNTLIQEVLKDAQLVRSLLFDKHAERNWQVNAHQDLTIAVEEKHELEGFGPWSYKEGSPCVQPPIEILNQMLTLRLHLDDCDSTNGALEVVRCSHKLGKLKQAQVLENRSATISCTAKAGDLLIMRPLIIHSSPKSIQASRRRIIHLEYSFCDLPKPLKWSQNA